MMDSNAFGIDPTNNSSFQPWVVNIEGEELSHIRNKYSAEVSEEDWEGIVKTAANILGQCPNPLSPSGSSTGLAIGKVQSGKTLSYSVLVALAYDNGYGVVIVLAGTKTPLLEQTYARLLKDLVGERPNITPFKNPTSSVDSQVIESVLHSNKYHSKKYALIVALKRQNRIKDIYEIFSQKDINTCPILIIDDEGDEASLNTMFRKKKESSVYKSIRLLRDILKIHAYIAYTATPEANLLLEGIDSLSPDFGILINPGSGYCGGSTFFGESINEFVQEIPIIDAENGGSTINDSLRLAIAIFFVGAVIRHKRGDMDWHSMLIHNSSLKSEHDKSYKIVKEDIIRDWRITLNNVDTDPEKQSLLKLFFTAYEKLIPTVNPIPSWSEVKDGLLYELWQLEIWMVNSLPTGRDPLSTPIKLGNNIFVGGNMLGRGLTIRGLAVTYITRRAMNDTNADTLEQRARWFGYKKKYLDVCRIFLTGQLKEDYKVLLRHENDFWDSLSRYSDSGIPIRKWPRMFELDYDAKLNPTRKNVAHYKKFQIKGWKIQHKLIEDFSSAEKNVIYVKEFFWRHQAIQKEYGSIEHSVIKNCPMELVLELLNNVVSSKTDWENEYVIEYLSRLSSSRKLETIDLLLMRNGNIEDRTKTDDKVEPFSGESANYLGDRYIHDGKPQFQVHIIAPRLRETDPRTIVSTSFAVYIPEDNSNYILGDYVVRGTENEY